MTLSDELRKLANGCPLHDEFGPCSECPVLLGSADHIDAQAKQIQMMSEMLDERKEYYGEVLDAQNKRIAELEDRILAYKGLMDGYTRAHDDVLGKLLEAHKYITELEAENTRDEVSK